MLEADISYTQAQLAGKTVTARLHSMTGRLIDPRVEARGKAMLAMCTARDEFAAALRDLGINPDAIIDVLRKADDKASDMMDRALAQRAA